MDYEGSIYRPPSEGRSLILQITVGCSHNKCTFCSMYKDKCFRVKSLDRVLNDLESARNKYHSIRRIFLADGDALILKSELLFQILEKISVLFPECERVSAYATPKAILLKTPEVLEELYNKGLKLLYMGIESGSNEVLKKVKKGSDAKEIVEAGKKIMGTNLKLSVTLISGLGGTELWRKHAISSAKVVSLINPDYLSLLTLMVDPDTEIWQQIQKNEMTVMAPEEILLETYEFIKKLELKSCIFRSNHASNYIGLKGTLNQDKDKLLKELKTYLDDHSLIDPNKYRSL
ncbi:MAG TPA: radical SAM protein [Clostridia bacterium]|nr:radical SAM protein [Clostridia bacterium]